jgi:nucleotide-binding universal stress UspA family protein
VCETFGAHLTLLSARRDFGDGTGAKAAIEAHLMACAERVHAAGVHVDSVVRAGSPAQVTRDLVAEKGIDLVVLTAYGRSGEKNWLEEGLSTKLVNLLDVPVLLVQVYESGPPQAPDFGRILVALDGSVFSEQALPYARAFGQAFGAELMLLSVPAVPESSKYRAPAAVISAIRRQAVANMRAFIESIAGALRAADLRVRTIVTGSRPARTIVDVGKREAVDLIMLSSQGRGGLDLLFMGSVAQQVVQLSDSPVLIVPIHTPVEEPVQTEADRPPDQPEGT